METPYVSEFLLIAVVHFLAMASPGPDFAMVVRQSVAHGRNVATWTSLGIGTGILLHVGYSLLGIGVVVSQSIVAFTIMKFAGAAYLIYIGIQSLCAGPRESAAMNTGTPVNTLAPGRAYRAGFLTNALNPKVTLFFLSLFTVVIDSATPIYIQAFYGVYMAIVTMVWFVFLSMLLGHWRVRALFRRFGHWIERATGLILITLGARLAFASAQT